MPRIPRTVLDAHREGLILGSACSEGEVFDAVVSQGVDAAVEVAKYYDFIEVMPPAIYAPLIAKEQVKDMEELQTIIKSLIEVETVLASPFWLREMSTISNLKKRFTVKLSSVVWDRGYD